MLLPGDCWSKKMRIKIRRPHSQAHRVRPGKPAGQCRNKKKWLFISSLLPLPRGAFAWWLGPWDNASPEEPLPLPLNITLIYGEEAGQEWFNGSTVNEFEVGKYTATDEIAERRSPATPPQWHSQECMNTWGMPELQREVDPRGYIIFSQGREQLGNNRFLISDGLFIAKALDRTLVEFPMEHSRIAAADAELGLCDYWDCASLCSYHRILDLWTFRSMIRESVIPTENFLTVLFADWEQTLLPSLVTADNVTDFFAEYEGSKVIVMKMAWKSGLRREPIDLLRPNIFYQDLVQNLLESQKWGNGSFMAVQWRTETSTGNLTACYERYMRSAVEEQRLYLGFKRNQVYVNTDLVGRASTTYNSSVVYANRGVLELIRAEYPAAMKNAIYDCLQGEQDSGVKAMISGLVSASAGFLLSSSFNGSGSNECQKPHSKYIDLVSEWRLDLLGKYPESIGELFPPLKEEATEVGMSYVLVLFFLSIVALAVVLLKRTSRLVEGDKITKLP